MIYGSLILIFNTTTATAAVATPLTLSHQKIWIIVNNSLKFKFITWNPYNITTQLFRDSFCFICCLLFLCGYGNNCWLLWIGAKSRKMFAVLAFLFHLMCFQLLYFGSFSLARLLIPTKFYFFLFHFGMFCENKSQKCVALEWLNST